MGIVVASKSTNLDFASSLGKEREEAVSSAYRIVADAGLPAEKTVLINGQLATREYLSITISVDHDVVDGAPAARFAQRLKSWSRVATGVGSSRRSISSDVSYSSVTP